MRINHAYMCISPFLKIVHFCWWKNSVPLCSNFPMQIFPANASWVENKDIKAISSPTVRLNELRRWCQLYSSWCSSACCHQTHRRRQWGHLQCCALRGAGGPATSIKSFSSVIFLDIQLSEGHCLIRSPFHFHRWLRRVRGWAEHTSWRRNTLSKKNKKLFNWVSFH